MPQVCLTPALLLFSVSWLVLSPQLRLETAFCKHSLFRGLVWPEYIRKVAGDQGKRKERQENSKAETALWAGSFPIESTISSGGHKDGVWWVISNVFLSLASCFKRLQSQHNWGYPKTVLAKNRIYYIILHYFILWRSYIFPLIILIFGPFNNWDIFALSRPGL